MMPDAALEATERQFMRLVGSCNRIAQIHVHPFAVDAGARGPKAREYIGRYYDSFDAVRAAGLDALVISGANPAQPELEDEPFWEPLVEVMEWAAEHVCSVVCSCLATHAYLKHFHGVARRRCLPGKRWGVFESRNFAPHPLVANLNTRFDAPHSHVYEVTRADVEPTGVRVLSESETAGIYLAVSAGRPALRVLPGPPRVRQGESRQGVQARGDPLRRRRARDVSRISGALLRRRGPRDARSPSRPGHGGGRRAARRRRRFPTPSSSRGSTTHGRTPARRCSTNWLGLVYQHTDADRRKAAHGASRPERPTRTEKPHEQTPEADSANARTRHVLHARRARRRRVGRLEPPRRLPRSGVRRTAGKCRCARERFETEAAIAEYNAKVEAYNASMERLVECVREYVTNAAADVERIRRRSREAIEWLNGPWRRRSGAGRPCAQGAGVYIRRTDGADDRGQGTELSRQYAPQQGSLPATRRLDGVECAPKLRDHVRKRLLQGRQELGLHHRGHRDGEPRAIRLLPQGLHRAPQRRDLGADPLEPLPDAGEIAPYRPDLASCRALPRGVQRGLQRRHVRGEPLELRLDTGEIVLRGRAFTSRNEGRLTGLGLMQRRIGRYGVRIDPGDQRPHGGDGLSGRGLSSPKHEKPAPRMLANRGQHRVGPLRGRADRGGDAPRSGHHPVQNLRPLEELELDRLPAELEGADQRLPARNRRTDPASARCARPAARSRARSIRMRMRMRSWEPRAHRRSASRRHPGSPPIRIPRGDAPRASRQDRRPVRGHGPQADRPGCRSALRPASPVLRGQARRPGTRSPGCRPGP